MSLSPCHVGGGRGDGPLANEGGVNEGGETPVLVSDSKLKIKADIASKLCIPLSASASHILTERVFRGRDRSVGNDVRVTSFSE